VGKLLTVCRIDHATLIDTKNVTFALELDEIFVKIFAKNNDRIRYLPKNIYEKFPKLKILNFGECSMKAFTIENFQKLFFMKKIDFSHKVRKAKESFAKLPRNGRQCLMATYQIFTIYVENKRYYKATKLILLATKQARYSLDFSA
jgi:hypothetical protein